MKGTVRWDRVGYGKAGEGRVRYGTVRWDKAGYGKRRGRVR